MLFQLLPRIIRTSGDRQPVVALVVQHADPHIARRGIAEEDELDVGAHRRHGLGIPHRGNVVERLHARRSALDAQQGQQRRYAGVVPEAQRSREVRLTPDDLVGRLDDVAQQRPGIGDDRVPEAGRGPICI